MTRFRYFEHFRSMARGFIPALALMLFSGCAVGPDYQRPEATTILISATRSILWGRVRRSVEAAMAQAQAETVLKTAEARAPSTGNRRQPLQIRPCNLS
jgi:4'-phosphopantetheinyl transferase EntD